MWGWVGALWGALGVCAGVTYPIYRLTRRAWGAYEQGLSPSQWIAGVAFAVFMAYTEGYRGFQRSFSPRTAARIRVLRERPAPLRTLLAPLFALGFFGGDRRTLFVAYGLTAGIATLAALVHGLEQPWRGIVDGGVVVGLSWGLISLVASIGAALSRERYEPSPRLG